MSQPPLSRRQMLASGAALAAASALTPTARATKRNKQATDAPTRHQDGVSPWPICLDTATIRPASLEEKVTIAATAGYDAIEPWEQELNAYENDGGDLDSLGQRIRDAGLFVPSVIGLWNAFPPTEQAFEAGLETQRRRMRQAAAIGAQHIQVVPQPARPVDQFDPVWASTCYRRYLEIGLEEFDLSPALVFVNFIPGCRRTGQAAAIALDADHPQAKIIPDVFHMYITDSGFESLKHLKGDFFAIFQFNDSPAQGPGGRELRDSDRVFPGDGELPLTDILVDLKATGFTGCVSLELYNETYWQRNLQDVAEEGLRKTLAVIEAAGV